MMPIAVRATHLDRFAGSPLWRGRTVADAARALAEREPHRAVFFGADPVYTVEQSVIDAEALAASLHELGVRTGDVVSFQLPNWSEAAVIDLACALVGAVVTPIVPIYRDAEVQQMLADSGSVVHFTAGSFRNFDYATMLTRLKPSLPKLREVIFARRREGRTLSELILAGRGRSPSLPQVAADAIKLLLYTSGTTGRPKGVLHTHNTLACFIESCARHWKIAPGEALLMPSPVTHITGYGFGLEMPFISNTRTVLMESWNAATAAALIDEHELIGTVAATPFLAELVDVAKQTGTGLRTLRFFGCGGAAVAPELIHSANETFHQASAFRVFGCSEAPMVTLGWLGRENAERAATTDGEIVDYEVKIVDGGGSQVANGTQGEILVRGPAMLAGYADETQTREAITADGYFRTGDLGVTGPDRSLTVTGRKKDLIIRGGENISPKEIEDAIYRHSGVAEVAVVSMPHPRLGEGVCAFVVPRKDHTLDANAIVTHVSALGLARQKCPERVEIVSTLPKTASGKVRKDLLRAEIREKLTAK
jgi:acyl-CoA synthetase (AMP-forming)/AMP-acid ligase II